MKTIILAVLLCIPGIVFAQDAKSPSQADRRFDGTWAVTLVCPDHTDNRGTALGFTYNFTAQVKDGVLHGEHGARDKPTWLSLDGKIKPDGSAEITATGVTNRPAYALYNVPTGTPYIYHVKARFEGSKGTGARVEGRVGNFTFTRQ